VPELESFVQGNSEVGFTARPTLSDRYAFVTLSLDAEASLPDVHDAARHADPRTTHTYDRARHNLDRHPTYALAGLID